MFVIPSAARATARTPDTDHRVEARPLAGPAKAGDSAAYYDPAVTDRARAQLANLDTIDAASIGTPESRLHRMNHDPLVVSLRCSLRALREADDSGRAWQLELIPDRVGLTESGLVAFNSKSSFSGSPALDATSFACHAVEIQKALARTAGFAQNNAACINEKPRAFNPIVAPLSQATLFSSDILSSAKAEEQTLTAHAAEARAKRAAEVKSEQRDTGPRFADVVVARYENCVYVKTLRACLREMGENTALELGTSGLILVPDGFRFAGGTGRTVADRSERNPIRVHYPIGRMQEAAGANVPGLCKELELDLVTLAGNAAARVVRTESYSAMRVYDLPAALSVPAAWPRPQFAAHAQKLADDELQTLLARKREDKDAPVRLTAMLKAQQSREPVLTYMQALKKMREVHGSRYAVRLPSPLRGIALTELGFRCLDADAVWRPLHIAPLSKGRTGADVEQIVHETLATLDVAASAIVVRGPKGLLSNISQRWA